jgi:hypothetical protein
MSVLTSSSAHHLAKPEPVFTVQVLGDEVDPGGVWGFPSDVGFWIQCSCGQTESAASQDLGAKLRGHARWHAQQRVGAPRGA